MKYAEILRAKVATLTEERAALKAEADALVIDETRSADEVDARADEIIARSEAIKAEIDAAEKRAAELDQLEEERKASPKGPNFVPSPAATTPDEVRTLSRMGARDAAMRSIESQPAHLVSDANRAHVASLLTLRTRDFDGDQIARRLLLTENEHYRSAFVKAATRSQPVFTPAEAAALLAFDEFRAASIGTDAAGGYGIPVMIDPTIIVTSGAADVPLLRVARIIPITNDEWKGVSSQGVSWSWDGEAGTVSDDTPTLAQPVVTAHKGQGFIPFSIEVGMDYPGFASEMAGLLEQGYMDLLAAATATGSGSSQPYGIFTALDANTNVEVVVTTDGAFGAVDIDKVWAALPERYRSRASWFMSTDVENEIRAFGSGTATSRFTVDQTEAGISKLNGRPVILSDYAPSFTGTTGASNILVVGAFDNYVVAQRAGMDIELVPHLVDVTNNRPTGQRGWYAWARVGADSVNDLGFRLLQNQ